jgi:hypothetical protein
MPNDMWRNYMPEKPILFSTQMVNAILEGRKTQTRRPIKRLTIYGRSFVLGINECSENGWRVTHDSGESRDFTTNKILLFLDCQVNDVLWLREQWSGRWEFRNVKPSERFDTKTPQGPLLRNDVWYWADGNPESGDWEPPRPSIHMPRWAARIFLRVINVRLERIQDITMEDVRAEGITIPSPSYYDPAMDIPDPWKVFARLWDSIYAKSGHGWDANPVVAVYEFKKLEGYR